MTSEPEQIRQDIARTQDELSSDINVLTDKVSPRRIARRRVGRMRGAYQSAKEKIMGTADSTRYKTGEVAQGAQSTASSMGQAARSATDRLQDTASSMGQAASEVPQAVRERAQGSPLAAGLIAFGAGVLVSSLLPRSRREQQLAGEVKQAAQQRSGQVKEQVSGAGQEMREKLREPAQQATEAVKSRAGDAASKVRDESRRDGRDMKRQTHEAAQKVTR